MPCDGQAEPGLGLSARDIEIGGEKDWLYSKPLTVEQILDCVGQCSQSNSAKTAY